MNNEKLKKEEILKKEKGLQQEAERKQARDLIYEEKNTFLSGGHRIDEKGIRGADSRMGYVDDMHTMVNIITACITTNGGMYELYTKLRDFNIEKGYGV